MSNFTCQNYGAVIQDSQNGYVTSCVHYPIEDNKTPFDTTRYKDHVISNRELIRFAKQRGLKNYSLYEIANEMFSDLYTQKGKLRSSLRRGGIW